MLLKGFTLPLFRFLIAAALLIWLFSPRSVSAVGSLPPLPPPVTIQAGGLPELVPEISGCSNQVLPVINPAYEQRIVDLVNNERDLAGLPPLKLFSPLKDAARYHAVDMAQDNYFNHDTYDRSGSSLNWVCSWSTRISNFYTGWSMLGENIAAGASTPEGAMALWMGSSGHRANILNSGYWEIGAGYHTGGGQYGSYWVQDFGRRSNHYPLLINRDAAVAASAEVTLYIYGDWSELRLQNDAGAWSNWRPFTSSVAWTLPASDGEHTVNAEMRSAARTAASSDTITLDLPNKPELGNLPHNILFTYNIPDHRLFPASLELTPANIGTADLLEWQIVGGSEWLNLSIDQGTTPQSFTITPTDLNIELTTTLTATITIQVTSPQDVLGSPHEINLYLQGIDAPSRSIYLPVVVN